MFAKVLSKFLTKINRATCQNTPVCRLNALNSLPLFKFLVSKCSNAMLATRGFRVKNLLTATQVVSLQLKFSCYAVLVSLTDELFSAATTYIQFKDWRFYEG